MEIGSNNFRDYLLKNIKAGSNKTNGKSNNKENINFKDYLLRNEKWLGTGDEAGTGNHKTDGILNNEEISIFFSQFNSEVGSDSNGKSVFTDKEFSDWYDANQDTIKAYYDTLDLQGLNNEQKKEAMKESMLNFAEENYLA